VHVLEIVEMDDKKLYAPDEAITARYQMLPKKSELRYQKEFRKIKRE
jgi:hypothetical protein